MEAEQQVQSTSRMRMLTAIAVYAAALLLSNYAFAQTKKRNPSQEAKVEAPAKADDKKAETPASSSGDSDRVDLKKLEEKYWAAKDQDYSVIQNRAYPKDKRFYVTLGYGPLMNDLYSIGRMTGVSFGYYFSERMGVELAYEKGALSDNDGVTKYRNDYGVQVDYNRFTESKNLMFILVPFYAKMSFFDTSILYFDMQFALGVGQADYEIVKKTGNEARSSTSIEFDVTQQIFFHRHAAVRFDIKNKFYNADRKNYNSGADLGSTKAQDTTILLGLTLFY